MKKFLIPIIIVVVLGFFYVYYTQTETQGQTGSLVSQNNLGTNNQANIAVGAEIISLLEKLDTIKLDTTLFTQPTFQSLRDFSITLRPQAVGRPNPFAPIGNEGAQSAAPSILPQQSSGLNTPTPAASPTKLIKQNTPQSANTNGASSVAAPSAAPDNTAPADQGNSDIIPLEGQ